MTKTGNQGARVDVYRGGEDTPDNTRDFLGIRNQITIIRGAIKDRLRWDFVQTGGGRVFFWNQIPLLDIPSTFPNKTTSFNSN